MKKCFVPNLPEAKSATLCNDSCETDSQNKCAGAGGSGDGDSIDDDAPA